MDHPQDQAHPPETKNLQLCAEEGMGKVNSRVWHNRIKSMCKTQKKADPNQRPWNLPPGLAINTMFVNVSSAS